MTERIGSLDQPSHWQIGRTRIIHQGSGSRMGTSKRLLPVLHSVSVILQYCHEEFRISLPLEIRLQFIAVTTHKLHNFDVEDTSYVKKGKWCYRSHWVKLRRLWRYSRGTFMSNFSFLALPSILGLVTGMTYGVMAHYADLPMSLAEHFSASAQSSHYSQY